jgi:hypothetical protein
VEAGNKTPVPAGEIQNDWNFDGRIDDGFSHHSFDPEGRSMFMPAT